MTRTEGGRARGTRFTTISAVFLYAGTTHALSLDIVVPPPSAVNESVTFVANVTGADGAVTYDFNFGDGTEASGAESTVMHPYGAPGRYPVIVKATDESSYQTRSFMLTVHWPLPDTPPSSSSPLSVDVARARVWCVNPDADTLSAFDVTTREKLFEVATERHPRTIAAGPNDTFWVVNQESHSITVHDGSSGAISQRIALDYASRPFGIVADGAFAYVSLQALGAVVKVDMTTREVVGRAEVGPTPRALSLAPDGLALFATRFISPDTGGEVYRIDPGSMSLRATHALAVDEHEDAESNGRGVPNYLTAAVLSPDGRSLFVPSKKDNILRGAGRDGLPLNHENAVRTILSRIDTVSGLETPEFRVDFNDRDSASAALFTPLGDIAFVALQGSNRVEIVDAYSGAEVGAILDVGRAPQGLALLGNVLVVHGFMSRELSFYDVTPVLDGTASYATLLGRTPAVANETLAPDVLLGKQIFYDAADTRMSRDGYISCASCHLEGFEDGRVWDFTDRGEGFRNTISMLGRRGTGHGPVHWTANFDEIQDFEHDVRNAFGGTGFLDDEAFNEGTRNTTLGDPKAGFSPELDALAAYVTSLDSVHPSPRRNPDGSLTEAGVRGRDLFADLECASCHAGEDYTDSASGVRHDVGTLGAHSGQRLGGTLDGFDTPTLLGIWETPPYLHDGSAPMLRDVFTRAGSELHAGRELTAAEVDDLVAFLEQIDGLPEVGAEPGEGGAAGMTGAGGAAEAGAAGSGEPPVEGGAAGAGGIADHAGAPSVGGLGGTNTTPGGAGGSVTMPGEEPKSSGCGCSTASNGRGSLGLFAIALLLLGRRARRLNR